MGFDENACPGRHTDMNLTNGIVVPGPLDRVCFGVPTTVMDCQMLVMMRKDCTMCGCGHRQVHTAQVWLAVDLAGPTPRSRC